MVDIKDYNFLKQNYTGIIEIFPKKAMNTFVLNKVLVELDKDYQIVKIFDDFYRAFKRKDVK